ncbi:MAG TPA: hypothetical protein VEO01_35690 [Pseudonocardiaceae bacterium]|nr:hypothetical protein [Pseudonocardiaceae bacterium]
MNPNTAGSYRNACEAVQSVSPNWQAQDVRRLDIDGAVARFKEVAGDQFSDATIRTYESNFRRAVPSFLSYLRSPDDWAPPVRSRRSTTLALDAMRVGRSSDGSGDQQTGDAQSPPIDLPIPLTDGRTARLTLPGGLTKDDVQLLRDIIPVYLGRVPTRDS